MQFGLCFSLVFLVVDWEEKLVPYLKTAGAQSVAVVSTYYSHRHSKCFSLQNIDTFQNVNKSHV